MHYKTRPSSHVARRRVSSPPVLLAPAAMSAGSESPAQSAAIFALLGAAGFASVASTRLCDAMLPALAQAFDTSTHEAAAVISAYAVAYSVMQLFCGPLGDRYGKQRVIGLAAV